MSWSIHTFFVLVHPHPFYCIKMVWIDQNKKGCGSTKSSLTVQAVHYTLYHWFTYDLDDLTTIWICFLLFCSDGCSWGKAGQDSSSPRRSKRFSIQISKVTAQYSPTNLEFSDGVNRIKGIFLLHSKVLSSLEYNRFSTQRKFLSSLEYNWFSTNSFINATSLGK